MNLMLNARDALNTKYSGGDENKRILISADTIEHSGREWIRITFEDGGPGVDESVREHLLDPFFTTKPAGKGTGLGLWISHNIVQRHGGDIQVESDPGNYTRIHVDLPVGQRGQPARGRRVPAQRR